MFSCERKFAANIERIRVLAPEDSLRCLEGLLEGGRDLGAKGVEFAGHSGKLKRGALPTADLAYVRDQCRQLQEVDKLHETLLRNVPAARRHPVVFEDLTGAAGKNYWKRLLAFVGARDLAASLETSLVRLGNATARRFANEEAVAAALRGAGC